MPRFDALRGGVLAGLMLATLTLTACGGVSETDLQKARQAGAQEQAQKEEANRQGEAEASLAAEVDRLKAEAEEAKAAEAAKAEADVKAKASADAKAQAEATAKASAPATQTRCSDRVSAGPATSCAFALRVEDAFYDWGGGNQALDVYSPVTGQWYVMSCQAGVPSVCRGGNGNNAVVYIR